MSALGIIADEPADVYHANEAISSTQLCDLEPCPLHFYQKHVAKIIPREPTKAFDVGSASHLFVLEGMDAFNRHVVIHPAVYEAPASAKKDAPMIWKAWNWNANACKEWAAPHEEANRTIISKSDSDVIMRIVASIGANPDAAALLTGGHSEISFRIDAGWARLQCRADKWHPDGVRLPITGRTTGPCIVDLKTCDSIEHFKANFGKLRYHMRQEFYRWVIRCALAQAGSVTADEIEKPCFLFVVSEKNYPHRTEVFEADGATQDVAEAEVHAALLTLRKCIASGVWPGAVQGVQTIGLKSWDMKTSEAKSLEIINAE